MLAGKLFNIPVKGTHAHAYITSFSDLSELKSRMLRHKETGELLENCSMTNYRSEIINLVAGLNRDLLDLAVNYRSQLSSILDISEEESSEGELAAMVSFAIAFPDGFMALVDTYDVKRYFAFRQISLGFPFLCVLPLSMIIFCFLLFYFIFFFFLPFFRQCFFFV